MSHPKTAARRSGPQGFSLLLVGTVVAGLGGYLVTWLVPFVIGAAAYTQFALFWGFIFLVISALSGVQQEVTRATTDSLPAGPDRGSVRSTWLFAGGLSCAVFVIVAATSGWWGPAVFRDAGSLYMWPAAFGSATYIFVAVFVGMFYGARAWKTLFWFMILEGASRLMATAIVLWLAPTQLLLAWATAIPYSLLIMLGVWRSARGELEGIRVSSSATELAWNIGRTILAATAMGTMISGFPLILGMSAHAEPADEVGRLILAATFTRAPLIVVALALQSYLIVQFQDWAQRRLVLFGKILSLVGAAAVVIGLAGWFLGPWMFQLLFPREAPPSAELIVVLVISSGLLGALCVSGAGVLSANMHAMYASGWVLAATTSIVLLNSGGPFYDRTVAALLIGPAVGLAVHTAALLFSTRHSQRLVVAQDVVPPRDIN